MNKLGCVASFLRIVTIPLNRKSFLFIPLMLCFEIQTIHGQVITQKGYRLPSDNVIQNDIRYAISLGATHMCNFFNPEKMNSPYFYSNYLGNGDGSFIDADASGVSHVIGRGLLAIMLTEETIGLPFPEDKLKIFEQFLKRAYDNPDNLNGYIDSSRGGKFYYAGHNMREGLYGLIALIKGRNRKWASVKADLMIKKLKEITSPEGFISPDLARKAGIDNRIEGIGGDQATTSGRLIDPLLEYYDLTGNKTAYALAGLYAKATLKSAFTESGDFKPMKQSGGHIHSLTSSLCGITKYAIRTGNSQMLQSCIRILENGVASHSTSWGWVDEVTADHPADVKLRGELNQTGDVVRTALALGAAGYTKYYEFAERFIRNMLLQGQHNEEEMLNYMRNNPTPKNDNGRDVLNRSIGGYSMELPNDRMREGDWPISTLDITSGSVHALCEAWKNRISSKKDEIRLNLLFDVVTDEIEIKTSLPLIGKIGLFNKSQKKIAVRIPEWVDTSSIKLEVEGLIISNKLMVNGFLTIPDFKMGNVATIYFDIPQLITHEKVDGQEFNATWWGNQVISIDPPGRVSPLPFKISKLN